MATVCGHGYHAAAPITCLSLHPGQGLPLALTGAEDGSACVANWATGRPLGVLPGHTDGVECAAFGQAGGAVGATGGLDGKLLVWDLQAMAQRGPACEHPAGVTRIALGPGATTVWTACVDGVVRLWDLRSGRCEAERTGHADAVLGLEATEDGRAAVTGSDDGTARVFVMGAAAGFVA